MSVRPIDVVLHSFTGKTREEISEKHLKLNTMFGAFQDLHFVQWNPDKKLYEAWYYKQLKKYRLKDNKEKKDDIN